MPGSQQAVVIRSNPRSMGPPFWSDGKVPSGPIGHLFFRPTCPMNLSVLKTLKFWLTAVPTLIGLALTTGLVLDGSQTQTVLGWVLAVAGVLGGHALPTPQSEPPQQ